MSVIGYRGFGKGRDRYMTLPVSPHTPDCGPIVATSAHEWLTKMIKARLLLSKLGSN